MAIGISISIPFIKNTAFEYEQESLDLFARMEVEPDEDRKKLINGTILNLKSSGIWNKLDCIYFLAAHSEQAAKLNWKADEFNLTPYNAPVFTIDSGYQGDGSTAYIDTGFDPSIELRNYALDDASLSSYSNTEADGLYADIGRLSVSSRNYNFIRLNNLFFASINSNAQPSTPSLSSIGHFIHQSNNSIIRFIKNGIMLDNFSNPPVEITPGKIILLGRNETPTAASPRQLSFAHVGAYISNYLEFYTIIKNYLDNL